MRIIYISKRLLKNGSVSGVIHVKDGRRRYRVLYEAGDHGHQMQWGAPHDVLVFTYRTFEKLIENREGI